MNPSTTTVALGSQTVELPLVSISDELTIALFMTIDTPISVLATACRELAEMLAELKPEVIATAATLGIPVAFEVARALGLEDVVVLQKSNKVHLAGSPAIELESITTAGRQRLILDRARAHLVAGRRVLFIDDVVSTGSSVAAAIGLLRQSGADIVGIGALFAEGEAWRERLGTDAGLVRALSPLPFPAQP
ncbi:MAG: adenine phosphoribosyltransferase [Actinobacteria bacterium]|nr:adenine phosphoribosyltransferase [Actinomycetota bacterium]